MPQQAPPLLGLCFAQKLWYHNRMDKELELKQPDKLAQMFVEDRIKGRSFIDISLEHGIPVEEVMASYRTYVAAAAVQDPLEYRILLQLRTEKIINHLWAGLEAGSFKHGEAVLKAVNTLQELHDLNEKTITHERDLMADEDAATIFEVLKHSHSSLRDKIMRLPLSQKAKAELAAWPEWVAESATNAVEEVIYAEVIND